MPGLDPSSPASFSGLRILFVARITAQPSASVSALACTSASMQRAICSMCCRPASTSPFESCRCSCYSSKGPLNTHPCSTGLSRECEQGVPIQELPQAEVHRSGHAVVQEDVEPVGSRRQPLCVP